LPVKTIFFIWSFNCSCESDNQCGTTSLRFISWASSICGNMYTGPGPATLINLPKRNITKRQSSRTILNPLIIIRSMNIIRIGKSKLNCIAFFTPTWRAG
jgi:hypothetical protein